MPHAFVKWADVNCSVAIVVVCALGSWLRDARCVEQLNQSSCGTTCMACSCGEVLLHGCRVVNQLFCSYRCHSTALVLRMFTPYFFVTDFLSRNDNRMGLETHKFITFLACNSSTTPYSLGTMLVALKCACLQLQRACQQMVHGICPSMHLQLA